MSSATVFLGLGSNQREPLRRVPEALDRLEASGLTRVSVSPLYRSEPFESPPQAEFVNAVACFRSSVPPLQLLQLCHRLEAEQGRRRGVFHGPRPLDLDILFFDDLILDVEGLTVPHPQAHRRRFVLAPLADIAADFRHPILGKTIAELLEVCEDTSSVVRINGELTKKLSEDFHDTLAETND